MPRGRNGVMGEQLAQVDNRDPFAAPVWRSPVYRTPEPVIFVVQLIRLVWLVLWFALTHPLLDAMAWLVVITWLGLGWPGVAGLVMVVISGLAGLRGASAGVVRPVRRGAGAGLAAVVLLPAPLEGRHDPGRAGARLPGQPMLPVLDRVHRTGAVDLVRVGLVTGQAPADFADKSERSGATEAASRPGAQDGGEHPPHAPPGVGRLRGLGMGEAERRGRRASPAGPA